jgi:ABC-type antimicrobial peptide transport system permease subunit
MVFMMMSQRVRDIGLMKAAGCTNDLVFGYFFTELLIVAFVGCFLGILLGILADFASTNLFNTLGLQISQYSIDFWLVLLVFGLFFILSLVFGAKPILDTTKIEPAKAISPTHYFGLSKEAGFRVISKSGFTLKIALRTLVRHKSATVRIVLCLSTVFVLVTVAVAGGLIADQTTKNWVDRAIGRNTILIAHRDMCNQYKLLLSEFYEGHKDLQFNYTDERYSIPESLLTQLISILGNANVDARLVLKALVKEVEGYILGNATQDTEFVGDSRKGESLIVGVEPENVVSEWFVKGRFLGGDQALEAVVGDTLAQKMFSMPLVQKIESFDRNFDVVGVCLDPIDNGNVTYVPIKTLQNVTGIEITNVAMVSTNSLTNRQETLNHVRAIVSAMNPNFEVFELDEILVKSIGFLGYIWSTIMFLPLFSLVTATLCLLGYVTLTINEQRQEFGILRAVGTRPRTVVGIISTQSFIVLLSSYAIGIAFGIITTLLILVEEPLVSSYTIVEIAGWLLVALAATFVFSLYPAINFAKKPVLETMAPA